MRDSMYLKMKHKSAIMSRFWQWKSMIRKGHWKSLSRLILSIGSNILQMENYFLRERFKQNEDIFRILANGEGIVLCMKNKQSGLKYFLLATIGTFRIQRMSILAESICRILALLLWGSLKGTFKIKIYFQME